MTKNTGGPAFPIPGLQHDEEFNGMSLRDYFAAKAMQALISSPNTDHSVEFSAVADVAYRVADAMLAEREKGKSK